VHADEAVDDFQAPATFVAGSGMAPDRASGTMIVYLDPEVVLGAV
jgi:hypothetical protein